MFQSILLATDGSTPARRAVDYAASLALRFRARVTVLNACLPVAVPSNGSEHQRLPQASHDEARTLVAQAARRLREMGVTDVDANVIEGPATNVILGVAESCQSDLIVIAARGSGTWPGQILGSVSMAITQRAECPVLIVR